MAFIEDPSKKYMPKIFTPTDSGIIPMETKNDSLYVGKDVFVNFIDSNLPDWDKEKIDALPGRIYLGDWSLEQLKNLNTSLKQGSMVLSVIPATSPIGLSAFGVLSQTGFVLDNIDLVLDGINAFSRAKNLNFNIDKGKTYSIYTPPLKINSGIVLSLEKRIEPYSENIKNLIPLQPGNSWTYSSDAGQINFEVSKTLKNVNGKELIVLKNQFGLEEYFGFYGDTLKYYGIKDNTIGGLFFDPPISLGDYSVHPGRAYETHSKIISEKFPEILGSVEESINYDSREKIVLSDGTPYGDCFKTQENINLSVHNSKTGQSEFMNETAYYWLAKNVGKVQQVFMGQKLELSAMNINPSLKSLGSSKSLESFNSQNSFSKKIIDSFKSVI